LHDILCMLSEPPDVNIMRCVNDILSDGELCVSYWKSCWMNFCFMLA
jgi:hypothetical protein